MNQIVLRKKAWRVATNVKLISGTFKSALWKILAKAKTRIGDKTTVIDFSPKAISTNELYGFVNMATREWKDGIYSSGQDEKNNLFRTVQKMWLTGGHIFSRIPNPVVARMDSQQVECVSPTKVLLS